MSKPKNQKDLSRSKVFSVKADGTDIGEVPSITKLLNRKKIVTSERTIARLTPPSTLKPTREKTQLTPVRKTTAIQKAGRRSGPKASSLVEWDPSELNKSQDGMKQVLHAFFERKLIQSALYLQNTQPTSGGASTPCFVASAAVLAQAKKPLWKGLQWDPQVFPEVWKVILSKGYVEFQPGVRNANCAAFGVDPMSWLTLIRIGTPERCEGLVAIISQTSLTLPLTKVLSHFTKESTDFSIKKKAA